MKREGYKNSTIRAAVKALRSVGRRCNLLDPNDFKDYMARAEYGENRRDHILGDEHVCKVARTIGEAKNLVEDGFDYVTDMDGLKLFRKRK